MIYEGTPDAFVIKRVYVRKYRDNGSVVAYVEWADGARTEGRAAWQANRRRARTAHFGTHIHSLFQKAKRGGLTLQRETW